MTTERDTAEWKRAIEAAHVEIESVIGSCEIARDELKDLGEQIEEQVDSLINEVETLTAERDEREKERDELQGKVDATAAE